MNFKAFFASEGARAGLPEPVFAVFFPQVYADAKLLFFTPGRFFGSGRTGGGTGRPAPVVHKSRSSRCNTGQSAALRSQTSSLSNAVSNEEPVPLPFPQFGPDAVSGPG